MIVLILLLSLLSFKAYAHIEDWYAYWGVGYGTSSYPNEVQNNFDLLKYTSRVTGGADVFGFYWPLMDDNIIGFVASSTIDIAERVDVTTNDKVRYSLTQQLIGLSAMRFFTGQIGRGIFLRTDIGIANTSESRLNYGTAAEDKIGYGLLLEAGYAIAASDEFRILFGVTAANNRLEGKAYNSIRFIVGGLW